MLFTSKNRLDELQRIIWRSSGGVYSRIDCNRQLLESLRKDAPEFLENHPSVEDLLRSSDVFFRELASHQPSDEKFSAETACFSGLDFPAPLPPVECLPEEERRYITPQSWIDHAYPLQQITIQLQGTRHSDYGGIVEQAGHAIARINAGELSGESSDDDFGYRFTVDSSSRGPSFFDKPHS